MVHQMLTRSLLAGLIAVGTIAAAVLAEDSDVYPTNPGGNSVDTQNNTRLPTPRHTPSPPSDAVPPPVASASAAAPASASPLALPLQAPTRLVRPSSHPAQPTNKQRPRKQKAVENAATRRARQQKQPRSNSTRGSANAPASGNTSY